MIGYVASLTPLAPGAYRFELELVTLQGGRLQQRKVRDEVVEDVAIDDVEMVFLGSLVQSLRHGAQLRGKR